MIVKVCGMRQPDNIREMAESGVNWMGFIFYERSPRYIRKGKDNTCPSLSIEDQVIITLLHEKRIKAVGVFVNAPLEEMLEAAGKYKLDYLQLHGNESPDICYSLQKRGISVIKAFSIADTEDLKKTNEYEGRADYFLFDTKCDNYGGSGKQFDWSVLSDYQGDTPFLLSGGICPESAEAILNFNHPRFAGIDLNSGFETEPGLKDIEKLKLFLNTINTK